MAVQIPFPLPSAGYAMNAKVRVNLDYLVEQFNQFNTGTATWDNVSIGTANSLTGTLTFYNASNAFYLTFKAGVTDANTTYTWPITASGGLLASSTAGVMNWTGAASVNNAVPLISTLGAVTYSAIAYNLNGASNGLAYVPAGGTQLTTLANGLGSSGIVLGSSTGTPKFVSLLGTTNQITPTINANDITLSTPQDIGTASSVQFSRVKVDAGTYASPGFYFASSTSNTVGLFAEANGTGLSVRAGASIASTVFSVDSTGFAVATGELRAPILRATTQLNLTSGAGSMVTIQALGTSFGSYTLTLPPDDGTSGYVLRTDGAGVLTWVSVSGAGGATTALDNLASVAINTTLVSDTNNTDDLGTTSIGWRSLYITTSIKSGSTTLATTTELGYLTGATSAIQTQLGLKAPAASPSFTGQILSADGSAGSPVYSFTSDPNTGIFSNAGDQLGLATNGAIRINLTTTEARCVVNIVSAGAANNLGSATDYWAHVFCGDVRIMNSGTGATTALLATANCPATTGTAPFVWLKFIAPDGSTVYVPAWK